MRVLLLNPPFETPKHAGLGVTFPLGLAYLASALDKAGIDVVALDAALEGPREATQRGTFNYGLSPEQLKNRMEQIKPDIVGMGCFFSSRFPAVLQAARIVKSIDTKIITVTGGIHPTLMPEKVCAYPELDFAIIGEGEESFVRLLKEFDGSRDFDSVDGLAFKRDGQVVINAKRLFIEDLDAIRLPSWDIFHLERYLDLHEERWGLGRGRYAPVITSRGCPYRCTFCSIHSVMGCAYRVHSPARVLHEIETLVSRYDVDEISFEDDNLTYDKDRFIQICKGIVEKKIGIKWNTPNGVHVGSLDEEALAWAKEAGCDSLNLGIESGDDHIRNHVIKKGLRHDKIYEVVSACHRLGIKPNAYFVIAMPGETDSSINKTKKYIKDLRFNNLSLFIATPTPGTKFYDDCVAKGYIKPDLYEDEFIDFEAAIFVQPSIETPGFDRARVELWRYRLLEAYYESCLRGGFFRWLIKNPRHWLGMILTVALYKILGEKLSFSAIRKMQKVIRG